MKTANTLLLSVVLSISACGKVDNTMSYETLVHYPSSCSLKTEQLKELIHVQEVKNFAQDPDDLNDEDRAYNSRLKATIWWYTWNCGQDEKDTIVTSTN